MAKIEARVEINRPIDQVFAYLDDVSAVPQWSGTVIEAAITSSGPTRVGTTYKYVLQVMGQRMETHGEITAYDPPKHSAWQATKSPFPMSGEWKVEAVEGGTRVTQVIEVTPGGFFKLAEPLLIKQQQSQTEADLQKLKRVLEAQ